MKNQTPTGEPGKILAWRKLGADTMLDTPMYSVVREPHSHPNLEKPLPFWIVDAGDCVNVFAIDRANPRDPEARLLMVEQYRVGSGTPSLEIPGGSLDDTDPSPLFGGRRELVEETGASADSWTYLGFLNANPAFMRSRMHSFLATGARVDPAAPIGDGREVLTSRWIRLADFPALVARGLIHHCMVVSAWTLLQNHLAPPPAPEAT